MSRIEVRVSPALKAQAEQLAVSLDLSLGALVTRLLQAAVRRGAGISDWEMHTVAIVDGEVVAVDPPDHEVGPPATPVLAPRAFWALLAHRKR